MATTVRVRCVICAGHVVARMASLTVDDECGVYRVRCPQCGDLIARDLTVEIRNVLVTAGALTVRQHMERAELELSTDERIWRLVRTTPLTSQAMDDDTAH